MRNQFSNICFVFSTQFKDFWCLFSTVCFPRKPKQNTENCWGGKAWSLIRVESIAILVPLRKENFEKLTGIRRKVMYTQQVQGRHLCRKLNTMWKWQECKSSGPRPRDPVSFK